MKNKLAFELAWWGLTLVVTAGLLLPVYVVTKDQYPFYLTNTLYIITFITITRYLFFLRFTFFAKKQRLKIALIFLCIPLVFYLVQELNYFQTFLDEEGVEALVGSLPPSTQASIVKYIYNEMLLFGVGSIISGFIFPFRLILSVWRVHNNFRD